MHTPFARSAMNAIENIAASACCKSAVATFCLVLLVGCSALPTPPNRPVSYDFGPGLTSLPAADRRASLPPIALADVEATGLSESSTAVLYRLNYADAQQLRPYTLARWTQPPVQLVQQALRAQLGLRRPVLQDADAAAQARDTARGGKLPAVLRIELEEFSHLFTSPAESTGLLRLRATLVDPTPAGETLLGQRVPFGSQVLVQATDLPGLVLHGEICEDVWSPIPPSSYAALAGATVLVNLSASNALVGKAAYRRQLVSQQSARCLAAYVYTSAGAGESSTDLAWDGQALISENGELQAESQRYQRASQLICADIDLERLARERMRQTSFAASVRQHAALLRGFRRVGFTLGVDRDRVLGLRRRVERFPYVPADRARRDERCEEVFHIQVQALTQRLVSSGIQKLVLGVSGGLDSTHALLVAARAMDQLGLPRSQIVGVTMPGYATSSRTRDQAWRLMRAIGCEAREIDIRPSCEQMLQDLGHPYAQGQPVYDVTFENVQAGERTSHLFRLANHLGALVLGTGDLSELALGWCTYGVGDHMSHYNVNASVPKTLIQYLVRWVAETGQLQADGRPQAPGREVLLDILATEISPELVPGQALQSTESHIGRYELQDFNLFHTLRHGLAPAKIAFLALHAWGDKTRGDWPDGEHVQRNDYHLAEIKRVLGIFVNRFFRGSQFKRSCVPNAPKVGSGGSLSPRGDWRAPSDSEPAVWLADLARIPD